VVLVRAALADPLADSQSRVKIPPVVPLKAQAFALQEVRLLGGPFKHAMELDQKYLLSLDTDQLLHTFRVNAGLPSTAQPLGGWEEPKSEVRGHFIGHYLSACALMYASTGDDRLKAKGDAMVAGFAECQAKFPSGYLSAYPEEFIDRVEARQRVWAPYYTLHKIGTGLLDMYVYGGNQQALDVAKKFGDWAIARNARLSDEQMQKMLGEEHGGMNEWLANLYGLTGEAKYLAMARRFNHQSVISPAAQRIDKLTGLHANTQIPKFVGTAREYELTGDETLKTASEFFWSTVAHERSYVIGGHSDGEHFSPKEKLSTAFGPSTTETCNTYNMLKLTRHLFAWDPRAEYADFYERALFNHILASQNPLDGMTCYYVPLRAGSEKTYCTTHYSFWCCTGTGVENHAKYGDSIYFHSGTKTLYVNLFLASELNWSALGLRLRQETRYPEEGATKLVFTCEKPVALELKLRHPWWSQRGMTVSVNGREALQLKMRSADGWANLAREWKTGDTVEIALPFSLRTEGFRDNPRRFAFLNGPVVLSAQVDTCKPFPALVAADDQLLASLKPVTGQPNTFTGPADLFRIPGDAGGASLTLEPFYKMHGHRHYMVYFDNFSPEQWQGKQAEYAAELARRKALEARTVDRVNPGEEQNERDHKLQGERSNAGGFGDQKYRHAGGGWFSWDLKVLPDQAQDLCVTYWGSDAGGRDFDILVDGEKLATEKLSGKKPGQFYEQLYPLTAAQTQGKTRLTVRFQAHPRNTAGGVFGCAILRSEK